MDDDPEEEEPRPRVQYPRPARMSQYERDWVKHVTDMAFLLEFNAKRHGK
jgi:hypothetical protein